MAERHKTDLLTPVIPQDASNKERVQSIDILRGIIMLIMLLDHISVIWNGGYDIDPARTTTILFFSQWVSHFCAPLFILLTGISAYLTEHHKNLSKINSGRMKSGRLLITRGAWLILLEISIFSFLLRLDFKITGDTYFIVLQVMWVIGFSLILLAFLKLINSRVLIVFGLLLIFAHNLIPDLQINSSQLLQFAWNVFHQSGSFKFDPNLEVAVWFPIIPWIGVMALGYGMGELFLLKRTVRQKVLFASGIMFTILFMTLRMVNIYGDPVPWSVQSNSLRTVMSFLNCEKYPPSLLFLLMTLGPGFMGLALFERMKLKKYNMLLVFGRTPLFFYLMHFIIVNFTGVLWGLLIYNFNSEMALRNIPFSYHIVVSYLIWIGMAMVLYFLCRWYAGIKFEKSRWWTYYL